MTVETSLQFAIGSPAAAIAEQLKSFGLNLFALLDANKIVEAAVPNNTTSVMLIGNYGRKLWDCIPDALHQGLHPVDDFTEATVTRVLTSVIGDRDWSILFPNLSAAPALQSLGRAAGWHNPSPLGNGIHPEHGLWFAYRAVVAIKLDITGGAETSALPANDIRRSDSPCIRCIDQPCIKSCPPQALSAGNAPNLQACVTFRSGDQSPCAERCLARQQCPVGVQSRYADEQIRYFYRQSLQSLQRWVAETSCRDG